MKLYQAITILSIFILCCSCSKDKDVEPPVFLCSTPSTDIQFIRNSIDPKNNSTPDEFTITLHTLGFATATIKFCENEFIIIYNNEENYWERYTRN